ncbi:MAG: metallophosphoesterase [Nannocystis sp.]|nr:metallophosphoesterase [Nannocystis sp.]
MSPPWEPSTPQAALHALLVELFSAEELRRWLRYGPDAELLHELPEGGSMADLADLALAALARRGRIDADFFERLEVERPHKKAAIAAVVERWATASTSRAPRRAPVHGSPASATAGAASASTEVGGDFVAGSKTVNHYYGATPGPPPPTAARPATAPTATASTATSERILAAWVHLSDLHFGHGAPSHQWNQVRVLDELLSDVCELVKAGKAPTPRLILVTGDVAFSGGALTPATGDDEYALAARWLSRFSTALHLPNERVFVVPGNHDVDRTVDRDKDIAGMVQLARLGVDGHQLDDALSDATGTQRLRSRQARYLDFAAGFGPTTGVSTTAPLWWEHREALDEGLTLRLCGLNTALLAAKDDKGRLRVGEQQLAELLPVTAPTEVTVVLGHHPAADGWLADEKDLEGALDEHAVAYLSGHVHEARSVQVHKGAGEGCLHVSAGAAHAEAAPADAPPTSHGYNIGALVVLGSGELAVRIWPRRWSLTRPRFEVDTSNTRKNQDYAEHRLGDRYRLDLPPPRVGLHIGELGLGRRIELAEPAAIVAYRTWLLEQKPGVKLIGVGGGDMSLDLDAVYVPLRARERLCGDLHGVGAAQSAARRRGGADLANVGEGVGAVGL